MDFNDLQSLTLDAWDKTQCWRDRAAFWYRFYEGDHWDDDQQLWAERHKKMLLRFNYIPQYVDNIAGLEVNNRKGISYEAMSTALEARGYSDVMNAASDHIREEADSEDVESEAFRSMIICGLGGTESFVDHDENPDGELREELIDFDEMIFDPYAKARNLSDGAIAGRVRQLTVAEAKRLFPSKTAHEVNACWLDGGRDAALNRDTNKQLDRVVVVHLQWREYENIYHAIETGRVYNKDEVAEIKELGAEDLIEKKGKRKVWKQAFLGANEILGKVEYAPSEHRPSINFMGYERKKGDQEVMWYGLVERMIDPQFAANKFLTKMVEASDGSGGGVMFEESAVDDPAAFEKDYADPHRATMVADGALTGGKIQPTPPAAFPLAADDLHGLAVGTMRNVMGINLEMQGMAERNQPGIVENSRKQSAYSALASVFDRLKSYRKDKGRLQEDYIREYFSDGRLVRLAGPGGAEYVPLVRIPEQIEFGVRVDEQSTSPDNKARTAAMLPVIQGALGGQLPKEVIAEFIPYFDLPAQLQKRLQEMAAQPDEVAQLQAQMQQVLAQLELQAKELEIKRTESEIVENLAQAKHNEAQVVSELAQAQERQSEAQLQGARTINEMMEPQFKLLDQVGRLTNGRA